MDLSFRHQIRHTKCDIKDFAKMVDEFRTKNIAQNTDYSWNIIMKVPLLNFERVPGVQLLKFRRVPGPTFELWGESRVPGSGVLVPLLHHACYYYFIIRSVNFFYRKLHFRDPFLVVFAFLSLNSLIMLDWHFCSYFTDLINVEVVKKGCIYLALIYTSCTSSLKSVLTWYIEIKKYHSRYCKSKKWHETN